MLNVLVAVGLPSTADPNDISGPLLVAPETVTVGGIGAEVPVAETFNVNVGVVGSFVTIVIAAVLVPTVVGVAVTVNVAVEPAAIDVGVAGVTADTTNAAEELVIDVNVRAALPLFLIENDV